ncbi:hypothetical protein DMC47_18225 [Nostoc sp. 3335mG]|nr:hypothetical protein DMC47_18225 [Nostoc sp. 3335mG]
MGRVISFLIAPAHRGGVKSGIWVICFALLLGGSGWFLLRELQMAMNAEVARVLETYARVRTALVATLDVMDRELTAPPCSADYAVQQRRVAFLPDGMNELFFFEHGKIICTANSGLLPQPLELGEPDVAPGKGGQTISLWLNRTLDPLGLGGLDGTFAVRGNHGVVVPATPLEATTSKWLGIEVVIQAADGRWWHTAGEEGLYAAAIAPPDGPFGLRQGSLTATRCDPAGLHCIAGRAPLGELLLLGGAALAVVLAVGGIVAAWLTHKIYGLFSRYWSFESRFLRRFQSRGVVCAYQPLLDLRSGLVTGCEVLARWRDVDGTLIFPDKFIPIIERRGLTRAFTRLVIERAYVDLLTLVPHGRRLQVNFNIFPQDLSAELLIDLFSPFLNPLAPFDLVIEIVETQEIQLDTAQGEIERLRGAGVSIYIDDFGAGYSSMHTLAGLSVDGVKLDRSFAMGPDGSVMARMLDHAIDMVQASGRKVVVEGVETADRLEALVRSGKVDFAQGYHISRPLEAAAFARFLSEHGPRPGARPRLVA